MPLPSSSHSSSAPRARAVGALVVVLLAGGCGAEPDAPAPPPPPPAPDASTWTVTLTDQPVEATGLWVAVSPIDGDTAWVAGVGGRWGRTLDGGASWETAVVPGADSLQFRDVEAFDASTAVLLSIGTGEESRVYRTGDGGATWDETFRMDHPEGFLDCFDFWDADRGLLYGDAVDGGLWVAVTEDGGRSWRRIDPARLPEPVGTEGGFASSGTCVDVRGTGEAWIGTAGPEPRILATEDGGESWVSVEVPLRDGESSGVTSLGVRPDGLGIAVGGSLDPEATGPRTAVSEDGGRSWREAGRPAMAGAPYGVDWVPDLSVPVLFAAGPAGLDWSVDGGATWSNLSTGNHWAVSFGTPRTGWAVGRGGRITRIDIDDGR